MEFIGSDFQTKPLESGMQDGKLLNVPQIADASANSIRQSIGEVQRINSTASNADAEAAGRKVVVQQKESGGIAGALVGIADLGLKYVENQKKAEAAAAEKQFILDANKLAANAPDLINKTNEGGIGYQSRVEALAAQYAGKVDAGMLQTQLLKLYSPVQQYQEQSVDSLRKEGEKIRETNVSTFVTQQVISLDTQLADLKNEPDPTKRQARIDNVYKILTDSLVNSKLRDSDKLYATNGILTAVSKASEKGAEVGAELFSALRTITETNQFLQEIEGMSPEQQAQLKLSKYATIRDPRIRDAYKTILDPIEAQRAYLDTVKQQQDIDTAVRRGQIDAREAFKITTDVNTELTAYYLKSDGNTRAALKKEFEGTPSLEAVTLAADNYLKDRDKLDKLDAESRSLASTVAGLGKSDAKERLGWVQDAFKLPNLSLNISVAQEFQEAVKNYTKSLQQGTPAEVKQAQAEVEKFNKLALDAANARIKQVEGEMRNTTATWKPLDALLQDPSKAGVIRTRYTEVMQNLKMQLDQNNKMTMQGVNPNFNMPQLAELQVGDVKLPLPFKAGTQVSFTSEYKEVSPLRGNREHAGIDIAVAENTPLIAPISGVIASADYYRGYGNTIDIRTPDGKIIRYAHLNAMDVKEGQQVIAGQVIGKTGNTGVGTGAHLHIEVRNDLYGGVEVTEDPIAWSVKNLNNANRGLRSRFGANTPDNIPPNAVPLSGAYLQNGQIVRTDGTSSTLSYNARNPIRNIPLPADKSQYVSSPDKNYGYQELASNAPFRKELHRVAKSLGTPTQWLADAMAFETGGTFAASITNSLGYTGLIQFGEEAVKDVGTTQSALRQMSNTENSLSMSRSFLRCVVTLTV
jgi:murein DD-endopeptidase MepM/ murein hydrolase activator NlpD